VWNTTGSKSALKLVVCTINQHRSTQPHLHQRRCRRRYRCSWKLYTVSSRSRGNFGMSRSCLRLQSCLHPIRHFNRRKVVTMQFVINVIENDNCTCNSKNRLHLQLFEWIVFDCNLQYDIVVDVWRACKCNLNTRNSSRSLTNLNCGTLLTPAQGRIMA